jgi:hypothetical protein
MSGEGFIENIETAHELANIEQSNRDTVEGLLDRYPNAMTEKYLEDGTQVAYFCIDHAYQPYEERFIGGIVAFSRYGLSHYKDDLYEIDKHEQYVDLVFHTMATQEPFAVGLSGQERYRLASIFHRLTNYPKGWHSQSLPPRLKPEYLEELMRRVESRAQKKMRRIS